MVTSELKAGERLRILALSEHFLPRLAGTATVAHETLQALAQEGHEVTLIAPGPPHRDDGALPYTVHRTASVFPTRGYPSRSEHYAFCRECDALVKASLAAGKVDVVHVLFGLFLVEILDTAAWERQGIAGVVTVHNVPPMECRDSWSGDRLLSRLKDEAKLHARAAKNRWRLKRHPYAAYVVPSRQVAELLGGVLPRARITVVGHGVSEGFLASMRPPDSRRPPAGEPLRLLTVGGYVPHKRQRLIPDVAARLAAQGQALEWDVVGPERNGAYTAAIRAGVAEHGLGGCVRVTGPVEAAELAALYDRTHLYVQPSIEEGFCLTALDAAASGLPVIASPAGALPELAAESGGILTESHPDALAESILRFVRDELWDADPLARGASVRANRSWRNVARELCTVYDAAIVAARRTAGGL